jgi:hypothetical protein
MRDPSKKRETVVEAVSIAPVFVDELSAIVPAGDVTHLVFSVGLPSTYNGTMERILQAQLIVPTSAVRGIGRILAAGSLEMPKSSDEDDAVTLQ